MIELGTELIQAGTKAIKDQNLGGNYEPMSKMKMDELMARMDRVERLEAQNAQRVREYDAQIDADPVARSIRSLHRTILIIALIIFLPGVISFLAYFWFFQRLFAAMPH